MAKNLYDTLHALLGQPQIVISAVPTEELRQTNGLTTVVLYSCGDAPVQESGALHNMKFASIGRSAYHWEPDPEALSATQGATRIAQLIASGIVRHDIPQANLPLWIYVENGDRVWMRAAKEFRRQFQAV
ncbi:MAG TPA: hypothetical protein VJK52_01360 [Candidatus Nanoarchaeia archaeon]|nr:hypothetical protein [Candidatus Nanoarchaeia archaeon]